MNKSAKSEEYFVICECLTVFSDYTVEEQPSEMLLIQELESGRPKPLVFVLNANLLAMVKLVNCAFPFSFYCAC